LWQFSRFDGSVNGLKYCPFFDFWALLVAHIALAFKQGTRFDDEAWGVDIAVYLAILVNLDTIGGVYDAAELSVYGYPANADFGINSALGPNGEKGFRVDFSFDAAFNAESMGERELAGDFDVFAQNTEDFILRFLESHGSAPFG
jgi:hypothetical protein